MTVRILLFASLREQAGWSERLVEPELMPATPLSLWRQLRLAASGPADLGPAADPASAAPSGAGADNGCREALPLGIRVALNRSFAAADTPLHDGDELAFLPPISGG